MKTLTLIRHAKSSWSNPDLDDFDRPLNKRGSRNAPFMGTVLRSRRTEFDQVFSSPAKRAIETAKIICAEIGYEPDRIEQVEALYHVSAEDLLKFVHGVSDDFDNIAVVGHNPGLNDLANSLATQHVENIPTAGIVVFADNAGRWRDFGRKKMKITEFDYPKKHL